MKVIKTIGITLTAVGLVLTGIVVAPDLRKSTSSAETGCTTDNSGLIPVQRCTSDDTCFDMSGQCPTDNSTPTTTETAQSTPLAAAPAAPPVTTSPASNCH